MIMKAEFKSVVVVFTTTLGMKTVRFGARPLRGNSKMDAYSREKVGTDQRWYGAKRNHDVVDRKSTRLNSSHVD